MKLRSILIITFTFCFANIGFSQTLTKSTESSVFSYISSESDSIIPEIGNRVKLQVEIPIDSIGKYPNVYISIGSAENKSDIFYQSYPLTQLYSTKDEKFSLSSSKVVIDIGEFDPDIREKYITVKLNNIKEPSPAIKEPTSNLESK